MSYNSLLRDMIKESDLSFKELAEKCKDLGRNIDPSYISKLVNGKIPPPSDEVSIILSRACGKNEDILILEAYLDKAPEIFKSFLNKIRTYFKTYNDNNMNQMSSDNYEIMEKILKDEPISKFVLDFSNSSENKFIGGIEINDDSMTPLINKGSEVIFSSLLDKNEQHENEYIGGKSIDEDNTDYKYNSEYYEEVSETDFIKSIMFESINNGDLIGAWDVLTNELSIRKFYRLEDTNKYILVPINNRYDAQIYDFQYTYFDLVTINRNLIGINDEKLDNTKNEIMKLRKANIFEDIHAINIIGKVDKIINKL